MQQSPTTDKDLGLVINYETKFADIRQRAKDEYIQRKSKRKKDKITPVPEAYPGKIVVVCDQSMKERHYYLCEVVDFNLWEYCFDYFGILLKTTNKDYLSNIGRLIGFTGSSRGWVFRKSLTKLTEDKIKWLNK